tara:strand:- start:38 stop:199 length:162 start_codon:yes stop_codon:yes gene_type:complete
MDKHIADDSNNPINYDGPTRSCDICGIKEENTYFEENTNTCEDCYEEYKNNEK